MTDGLNNARTLRVLEMLGDFRTLQTHIQSLVTRPTASPPDVESRALVGYALLVQCQAEARRILALSFEPGSLGIRSDQIPATEVQKGALQRIVLDVSARRFSAHKVYLRAAAGIRWAMRRTHVLQGQKPNPRNRQDLAAADQRLREEVAGITDQHVFNDLRRADTTKGYWLNEDPSLERVLAWARTQQ